MNVKSDIFKLEEQKEKSLFKKGDKCVKEDHAEIQDENKRKKKLTNV